MPQPLPDELEDPFARAPSTEADLLRLAADLGLEYLRESGSVAPFPSEAAVVRARPAGPLSAAGLPAEQTLRELAERFGPATVRSHHGRYFGFVHGSSLPVALAAKWLTSVWDQNTPLYALSPAASLLESEAERWLAELLGLPPHTAVGFVSSTSQSLLTAVFVARQALLERAGWNARARGLRQAPPLRVVVGEQVHVAVWRALAIAGFGRDDVEVVPADGEGRLDASRLPRLDERTLLVLQAGNIFTGAFDDFAAIVPAARRAGAWVHVDGAFGLWAAACGATRRHVAGVESADSWSTDCHKTLNTPFSCGLFLCRERSAVSSALASGSSYLGASEERNGMDYSPDMARRFMAAEVWATLRWLGRSGVARLVERLCARARDIAAGLAGAGYTVVHDVVFNQVCVRLDGDEATRAALRHLQRGGIVWCGGGVWNGRAVIRISVSSWRTTPADVAATVAAFREARQAVDAGGGA